MQTLKHDTLSTVTMGLLCCNRRHDNGNHGDNKGVVGGGSGKCKHKAHDGIRRPATDAVLRGSRAVLELILEEHPRHPSSTLKQQTSLATNDTVEDTKRMLCLPKATRGQNSKRRQNHKVRFESISHSSCD